MSVGEIVDAAVSICRRYAAPLVTAVAVVLVPVHLLTFLLMALGPEGTSDYGFLTTDFEADERTEEGAATVGLLVSLLALLAYVLVAGACYRAISEGILGQRVDWRESLGFAARRFHSLLWIALLGSILIGLGFVALLVPGIWLYAALSLSFPALLSEGARGTKALKRSRRLVQGHWWHVAGALLVSGLLIAVIQIALGAALGLALSLVDSTSQGFDALLATLVSFGVALIATPFQLAVLAFLYFDMRVRKEGIDLAIAAERIGSAEVSRLPSFGKPRSPLPPPPTPGPPPPPPGYEAQ